jgi:hypothetical protein
VADFHETATNVNPAVGNTFGSGAVLALPFYVQNITLSWNFTAAPTANSTVQIGYSASSGGPLVRAIGPLQIATANGLNFLDIPDIPAGFVIPSGTYPTIEFSNAGAGALVGAFNASYDGYQ